MLRRSLRAIGLAGHSLLVCALASSIVCYAQSASEAASSAVRPSDPAPANRLQAPIDEKATVVLKGTVHSFARKENDRGAAADSLPLTRIQIILGRSETQEAALKKLIADLHTPTSANFHRWLTPEQFGKQFGPSDADISAISVWLQRHGFGPVKVSPGKQTLETSATVAQFRETFHSQIRTYEVNGEKHYANATDPQIPAALAPVFRGFASLNNFRLRSAIKRVGPAIYNPAARGKTRSQWTVSGQQGNIFALAPGDFAVQYDLNPLYAAGTDGTGQTIAIINEANIDLSLVNSYRSLFGLPVNPPHVIIDGNDPGIDGVNNPDGPNYASVEAYLDVELAGSVAPKATVDLVIGADTALQSGLSLAAEHAVYSNLAPVISLSFLNCETGLGSANQFWSNLWAQAAAQGITVMASSGDNGSAGCDDFDTQYYAVGGQAVSGLASTPYNVAVGGTDFHYTSSADLVSYWTNGGTNDFPVSNSAPVTTLLGPVPEQPWNDSQYGLNLLDYYDYDGAPTTIVAGSGGRSTCGQPALNAQGGIIGCSPYPKPAWQVGVGVPQDGVRDLPDVSLFAANGANYSLYPICASAGDCQPVAADGSVQFSGIGGTSASSPAFAGIMALVNQKTGSRQGQANFVLYPLAAQFPDSFHDVTVGTNSVPCNVDLTSTGYGPIDCIPVSNPLTTTDPVYGIATEGQIGSGTTADYNAAVGYDLASGLGSIDANNLVNNWTKVAFSTSATTLTPSSTSFVHGTTITVSGSVTGSTSPLPTGEIALMTTSSEPLIAGDKFYRLNNGSFSGPNNHLPGGSYTIFGKYSGDALNAPSASTPVAIKVTPEKSSVTLDLLSSTSQTSLPAASTFPYGTQVLLSSEPVPLAFYKANTACIKAGNIPRQCALTNFEPPTGTVSFSDGKSAITSAPLNAEGDAEYNAAFGVGAHSVTAAYSGDSSYGAATSPAVAFTVVKDTPVLNIVAAPGTGSDGNYPAGVALTFLFGVVNEANIAPATGTILTPALAPTGTLSFTGAPAGVPATVNLSAGTAQVTMYPEGLASILVPATAQPGTYNVTISYSGDANYAPVTLNQTITLEAKPVISTVAGDGIAGFTGDGGLALNAKLSYPTATVTDSAGNLYILDASNSRVRKLTKSTGVITTVAGGGTGGDGGLATDAFFYFPLALAIDQANNLYISDITATIRKVTASTGIISTFAGNGQYGSSGDGGPATSAQLSQASGLAFDSAGNLYIADTYNSRVRMVSAATGIITTVAGNGTSGFLGDGGAATAAELYLPFGVAVDGSGNIFVADTYNLRIREVSASTGLVSTVAGNGTYGSSGDGGSATAAQLGYPQGVSVDSTGDLFIADTSNSVVREVLATTGTISTVAGNSVPGYSGDGGPAVGAEMNYPTKVGLDSAGNFFISDAYNNVVRKVSTSSNQNTQVTAVPGFSPAPGTYTSATSVTLTETTANATIYYTLDGTAPTSASAVFSTPIPLSTSTVIRAMATSPHLNPSAETAASYFFAPAAPAFTPAGGTYTSTQTVTLTDATPGVFFNYTTDGSDPNASNTTQYYSGPITVAASETVKAIAYSSLFPASPASAIANASYVISVPNTPTGNNLVISTVAGNGISGYLGDGGVAINAELSQAGATAVDSTGNLYIADQQNNVVRKVTKATGVITTFAGTGTAGFTGDGGQATNAQLSAPAGLAFSASGDLYISDGGNNLIRKVSAATGKISTFAGINPSTGQVTLTPLLSPAGLAFDSAGDLYVCDVYTLMIYKIAAGTGAVTTVAGDGSYGYSGDNGPGSDAAITLVTSIATDSSGNLYLADTGNKVIREVNATTGVITTIAGTGLPGTIGDGGLATNAEFISPRGVALDAAGDIFVADAGANLIREISASSGLIGTIAGDGMSGYGGDGGPATSASFSLPSNVTLDTAGDLFIGGSDSVVREISTAGTSGTAITATPTFTPAPGTYGSTQYVTIYDSTPGAAIYYTLDGSMPTTSSTQFSGQIAVSLSTVIRAIAIAPNYAQSLPTAAGYVLPPAPPVFAPAGGTYASAQTVTLSSEPGTGIIYTTDGSSPLGSSTSLNYVGPISVAFDETLKAVAYNQGTYVFSAAASASYVITGNPINGTDRVIATVAGNGMGGYSGDGGPAINAELYYPGGSAVDSAGNLYIADSDNSVIRKVNKATGVITTVAGNGQAGYSGDGKAAVSAELGYPQGVALDAAGNLYIADTNNSVIRKVTASTGIITTVAGIGGQSGATGDGGLATQATLSYPNGVAVDSRGFIYIADTSNNKIREVFQGSIVTFAGTGVSGYSGDAGAATLAELSYPVGVAVDAANNVYIADTDNSAVREVGYGTGKITTIAGRGSANYEGDGGPAQDAYLSYPEAVAVDSSGNVYIADSSNSVVREILATSGVIVTVAGDGGFGYSGDGGPAIDAQLGYPIGVAADATGDVFVVDNASSLVREVFTSTTSGTQVTATPTFSPIPGQFTGPVNVTLSDTTAGATIYYTTDGSTPTSASSVYSSPIAVSVSTVIRALATAPDYTASSLTAGSYLLPPAAPVFTPAGGSYTSAQTVTISGAPGTYIYYTTDGTTPLTSGATMYYTAPIKVSTSETIKAVALSIAFSGPPSPVATAIYVLPSDNVITTVAGSGNVGYTGDGGPAIDASFNFASHVVADGNGNIYISDSYNNVVRKVAANGRISTYVGNGTAGFSGDGGPANQAELSFAEGIALDAAGNLYIADEGNQRIRKVTPAGIISTVAGSGTYGFSGDGGPATSAALAFPFGIAIDQTGALYIGDYLNQRVRMVSPSGTISTVAGSGTQGFSGDGGSATSAALFNPIGVAVDKSGNLYIADYDNGRIRQVNLSSGIITTAAGGGTGSFGIPANTAQIFAPFDVTVDSSGNFYFPDGNRIGKVTASTGIITSVAGNGTAGFSGDGGPATSAELNSPSSVGIDPSNNLYIADGSNERIRKVSYSYPVGNLELAVDSATKSATIPVTDTLFVGGWIADPIDGSPMSNVSVLVDGISVGTPTLGIARPDVATFYNQPSYANSGFNFTYAAGSLTLGSHLITVTGVDSNGLATTLGPLTITVTAVYPPPVGNLEAAVDGSTNSATIPTTDTISITGWVADPTDGSPLSNVHVLIDGAVMGAPTLGIARTDVATYYSKPAYANSGFSFTLAASLLSAGTHTVTVAAVNSHGVTTTLGPLTVTIVQVIGAPADNVITTFAGSGAAGNTGAGGPATAAELNVPLGLAFDRAGNLYFSDFKNCLVHKVDAFGTITTIAGTGTRGYSGDGGAATSAELNHPQGLAFDSAGNLYITDGGGSRIRKVTPGGVITTVAGNGTAGFTGDGGLATNAELGYPGAIAFDSTGNFYIADYSNNRVRKVDTSGMITTVAGDGTAGHTGDGGAATAAELNLPQGVAVDASGNIYIAELGGNVIRKVDASGIITTAAGNGTAGYSGDGGSAPHAELNQPYNVHVDAAGNLYIADSSNNVIRKVATSGTISTIAGNSVSGFAGDGGSALAAKLNGPGDAILDSLGNLFLTDPNNNRVRKVTYLHPVGNLELAVDSATKSTTIPTTDTLFVSGWVADLVDGSPLSNVTVLIDGTAVGKPTLGIARPDVATFYNQPSYANSGFNFTYAASSLTVGSHSVTVTAIDSNGLTTTFGPLTITITQVNRAPVGKLEQAVDSVTAKPTISKSGTLFVSGWSADYQDNGAAKSVQILVDGTSVGSATLGKGRPDVALYFNNSAWANTGWNFTYAASKLSTGAHNVTALATDSLNLTTTFGPLTITVTK